MSGRAPCIRTLVTKEVRDKITNAIEGLPLHQKTLLQLQDTLKRNDALAIPLLRDVVSYETTGKSKFLESIIYRLYFQWLNEVPSHLKPLLNQYEHLKSNWPIERHIKFKNAEPEAISLRNAWMRNKATAVDLSTSDGVIKPILNHFRYLRVNEDRLCKKKVGLPILEVPLNVFGTEIPECRVNNLLKKRIAHVKKSLLEDNPMLSPKLEDTLHSIINDSKNTRALKRVYLRSCSRAYTGESNPKDSSNITFHIIDW
ncbi:hypothetical protein KAFR_0B02740 [Kazachstania africana CBS 2517]|uniref:Genetic interactor of prohibitin 5, mitochondrial n=1 Tax=Kazachstania africana (strain ATCC 22294 / BCRC 22015 / CBS 2517 / CECT 1963 / NBRC 1671 / NRRL Y-8276) TaxID=1071382 RepID=H2AQC1_KAZAF|nr:hypothetical protein KAFR_0B02740 [Kazachstania africana CBS 2517]CCF56571.1 hypothetical protein KAFR_0B02740 [Kazachstania africana CBS 2517]